MPQAGAQETQQLLLGHHHHLAAQKALACLEQSGRQPGSENKQISAAALKQKRGPGIRGLREEEERESPENVHQPGPLARCHPSAPACTEQRWGNQDLTILQPQRGRIQRDEWE